MRMLRWSLAALCAFAACANVGDGSEARRARRDASPAPDVTPTGGGASVACYTEGSPGNTCTLPVHCCFTNYSSQHDGYCTTDSCAYGTISCDGPEDCGAGESCCAHAITDPDLGLIGYSVACAASCGTDVELCHTSATCTHGSCVSAYGTDNDLPRVLDICQ